MYERKKRGSVRAGSASYVSRRHFSTICQSLPPPVFLLSSSVVLSGFNLHSVTPRAPSLADCLRWAQFVAGKNGRTRRNAPLPLSARRESKQLGCERQSAGEWNVEANAIFPHTACALLKKREFRQCGTEDLETLRNLCCVDRSRIFFHSINAYNGTNARKERFCRKI